MDVTGSSPVEAITIKEWYVDQEISNSNEDSLPHLSRVSGNRRKDSVVYSSTLSK